MKKKNIWCCLSIHTLVLYSASFFDLVFIFHHLIPPCNPCPIWSPMNPLWSRVNRLLPQRQRESQEPEGQEARVSNGVIVSGLPR